ncbi:MAG: hypothetical protein NTW52_07915 [Planctomycetota bacterium]|nr:hypothetical protein [Planctomycetota bacterium]
MDVETPWVLSLFRATRPNVHVDFLGVLNIREKHFKPKFTYCGMFRIKSFSDSHTEQYVWTFSRLRFFTRVWLSVYLCFRFGVFNVHDAVVFTNPFSAHFSKCFRKSIRIYDAHDVFEFYSHLSRFNVRELEEKLLNECDIVAAVARRLASEFEMRRKRPVLYLPMAASTAWLNQQPKNRPADLPTGLPIVGCTGQINATYDWALIEMITQLRADHNFVFVGPNVEGDECVKAVIANVFARPNVFWLGPKPHDCLKDYVDNFDVCFCPLKPSEHSDCRSPLRLFDFLTTQKPIISTNIVEAHEHTPHVFIANNALEMSKFLQQVANGEYFIDTTARRQYIAQNTWEFRANTLINQIEIIRKNKAQLMMSNASKTVV